MNLHTLYLTQNECYQAGRKHVPRGVVVHSTGANNPTLRRYVGPDDGLLGVNPNGNHWNTFRPGGSQICPHAFIGRLADGSIATYQTLPWDICCWLSGSGSKDNANWLGYLQFEICEDDLTSADYCAATYREAAELCAYLCRRYELDPLADGVILCHKEAHDRGIASNHGDVLHWWPKHGYSMDGFRADVAALLRPVEPERPVVPAPEQPVVPEPEQPAEPQPWYRVQVGAYRNRDYAEAMLKKLKAAGFDGYVTKGM